jgi:PAS domain S-box-containing protein
MCARVLPLAGGSARRKAVDEEILSTINLIPSLVWRISSVGAIEFYNDRWLEYAGDKADKVTVLDWRSIIHAEDVGHFSSVWSDKLISGEAFETEARLKRFDGQYRWFRLCVDPQRDQSGTILFWYGVSTEIEDRKYAEKALRESEQRFRDFSDSTSDWYWETGPDHRFTYMSDRPEFAFIADPSRIGRRRWEVAADFDEEPAKWDDHIRNLEAHRPFHGFTYRVQLRNESMRYITVCGRPRFGGDGGFIGYGGGASDVTTTLRAKQSEQALREVQFELAHVTRLSSLGELSASIAHEVNQPLAGIAGNGSACLRWLDRDSPRLIEARASVEAMIRETHRATTIISRIRALAKKTAPQMSIVDINEIIRDSLLLMQVELHENNVKLLQELAFLPLLVIGDRVQLQQVLINLLMNGIQAMKTITGRTRQITVRSRCEEGEVSVQVQDSGTGIDPGNIDRVFKAFFTTKPDGLGIGLSVSRSLMAAHQGHLTIRPGAAVGAIFQMQLPSLDIGNGCSEQPPSVAKTTKPFN